MERLKVQAYVLTGVLLATAAYCQLSPTPGPVPGRTESWMEKIAPQQVSGFSYVPDLNPKDGDTLCSYKTSPEVYKELAPTVGILARRYRSGNGLYDVTLIASRNRASFHDPRVCFSAQGYNPVDGPEIMIPTKTRGDIPATLVQITTPGGQPSVAVYFYRGPHGFFGSTTSFKIGMFIDQFKGNTNLDGVFYRFIPDGDTDVEHLKSFIGKYMDEAGKASGGYF